ncbi:hypothetical protein RSAG8_10518, partial [Rhizoctonia solani AG-8 WAC10335]
MAQNRRSEGVSLPESWPSNSQRASLTGHANGLFLWVSVATAHVDNSENPHKALEEPLALRHRSTPDAAMDTLCNRILRDTESSPNFNLHVYQTALEAILSAKYPLTIHEINQQICLDPAPTLAQYVQHPQKCDPRFLVCGVPWIAGRVNAPSPRSSTPLSAPQRLSGRRDTESNNLSTLFSGYPRAWDLVPDVGSQIKEGSVSRCPITHGGFGDIWSARHIDGREITTKTLRLQGQLAAFDQHKLQRRAISELSVWRKFKHPNILKLLGICAFGGEIGMVSEWMPNGNIIRYTMKHNEVDKIKLIADVVDGLAYLHGNGIVVEYRNCSQWSGTTSGLWSGQSDGVNAQIFYYFNSQRHNSLDGSGAHGSERTIKRA